MTRDHPLAPHRSAVLGALLLLALLLALALAGPLWWQRIYHPLAHERVIAAAANENGVDPYLIAAVINAESGFEASEVSEAGAVGLMQLLPQTAREAAEGSDVTGTIDEERLKDAEVNIALGTRHLAELLDRYGTVATALAAYNAGAANADRWVASSPGQSPSAAVRFPETRAYVDRVLRERERYRELYPDAFR